MVKVKGTSGGLDLKPPAKMLTVARESQKFRLRLKWEKTEHGSKNRLEIPKIKRMRPISSENKRNNDSPKV